jgi:hypothetical protein
MLRARSIVPEGGGHGKPAMRYAARHAALSRVEEIPAHSYGARDLVPPDSPNAFGARQASLEDIAWAAGIEHRLAVAASASASASANTGQEMTGRKAHCNGGDG